MNNYEKIYIKFNSYIKKCLHFTRIEYIKRECKETPLLLPYIPDSEQNLSNETDIINKLYVEKILKSSKLTSKQLFIIYHYYYLNSSDVSIAKIMNTSKQNINKQRKNSLNKLRECL